MRNAKTGAADQRVSFLGSWIPLAKTAEERRANADPRLSVEERYRGKEDYLSRYKAVAEKLIEQRYFVREDLPLIMERGVAEWERAVE